MHLPVSLQVLITLVFLTAGVFQRKLAESGQDGMGIIRTSARCIKFRHDVVDQANILAQVAARVVFPNVRGAIDCTHIKALSEVEFDFVNTKAFSFHQRANFLSCRKATD